MWLLFSGIFGLGSLATLGLLIAKAPEAYETEGGLRIVRTSRNAGSQRGAHLPVATAVP